MDFKLHPYTLLSTDFHFGHKTPDFLNTRGFTNVKEHDEAIFNFFAENKGSDLVNLGDLTFTKYSYCEEILKSLSHYFTQVLFVYGNHDKYVKKFLNQTEDVKYYRDYTQWKNMVFTAEAECKFDGNLITFSHCPHAVWNKSHYGSWHIHGHTHGTYLPGRPEDKTSKALDVSIESTGKWGIHLKDAIEILNTKNVNTYRNSRS